jgi:hypothetical protein
MAKPRSTFLWWGATIAMGTFLYLASYGPANSLVRSGVLSARGVDRFYQFIPEKVRYNVILAVWTKLDTRQGVGDRD